ncbi:uncharacterized protein JCM10292_003424 [Rhodotorula paludigena]|uniref:uncharacterized protein n=1 Tax=Rhodotorula paludigena TaxID=86838 RepID=UPI00317AA922
MSILREAITTPQTLRSAVDALVSAAKEASEPSFRPSDWAWVARGARQLADGLRSEDLRTAVGEIGSAITAVARLLAAAVQSAGGGGAQLLSAQTELARVVGNLCFDHDANRQQVLDAGIPLLLAQLLARTLDIVDEEDEELKEPQRRLSVDELKFLRATTGAFLNSSLKFDPMRRELTRKEILTPLLAPLDARTTAGKRTEPVCVVGCWARDVPTGMDEDEWEERLALGRTTVEWAANVLEDVLGENKDDFPPAGVLALASVIFAVQSAPSPSSLPSRISPEDASDYLDTDVELLTVCSSLLETLALNLDSVKSALAFSTYAPSLPYPQSTLLHHLLTFIHKAAPPPYWMTATSEPERLAKAFSTTKASLVRAVVEAPNSDLVMERLWAETRSSDDLEGKSWLVEMLVSWVEEAQSEGREDMLICAAHMLAALGRKDEYTRSLVHDYGLAAPLARIVRDRVEGALNKSGRPGETTQILFGVVSLLRHLAIPADNRQLVGETGVIAPVTQLLRPELDVVGPLQPASIGLLKHLMTGVLPNALVLLEPTAAPDSSTSTVSTSSSPVDLLLALNTRTDDLRTRSESARVLVNLIRTLFSAAPSDLDAQRQDARQKVVQKEVADALCELVRRSEKFPLLVNEGVVGLTLLAGSGEEGSSLVVSSLLHPPSHSAASPPESSPSADSSALITSSAPAPPAPSPADEPSSALHLVARWFALVPDLFPSSRSVTSSAQVRPEMLSNACTLLLTLKSVEDRHAAGAVVRESVERARAALEGEEKDEAWSALERALEKVALVVAE